MAHSFSAGALVGFLIVGLVVGGIGGYYGSSRASTTSAITSYATSTTTIAQSGSTITTTVTTTAQTSSTGLDLKAALQATSNASLAAPEWNFAKGSLTIWIENTGNESIILAPNMFMYNGSYVNSTHFVVIDPKVVQFGTFAYIPPGSSVIVELITPNALTGDNSTLSVLNYSFSIKYGTSRD